MIDFGKAAAEDVGLPAAPRCRNDARHVPSKEAEIKARTAEKPDRQKDNRASLALERNVSYMWQAILFVEFCYRPLPFDDFLSQFR
ncbi:MAG: hypothetical protein ABTQ31_15105 [Rhizobiaceae bacterium]